jgi:hypothetical protein
MPSREPASAGAATSVPWSSTRSPLESAFSMTPPVRRKGAAWSGEPGDALPLPTRSPSATGLVSIDGSACPRAHGLRAASRDASPSHPDPPAGAGAGW